MFGPILRSPHSLCHVTGRRSGFGNVSEAGDADDIIPSHEHAGAVAADAQPPGVVDVNLTGGRAIAEVVEVGIDDLEELRVVPGEGTEADVAGTEVDDHNLAEEAGERV
jgi:hypothetical protein